MEMERASVPTRTVSHSITRAFSNPLTSSVQHTHQVLSSAARRIGIVTPPKLPGPQGNTEIRIQLYNAKSSPAVPSPLNEEMWWCLLEGYPGSLREDIRGMIRHGVKLGYELSDTLRYAPRRVERNLPMDTEGAAHIEKEIESRLSSGMVIRASETDHIISSPLGAVPKPAVGGVKKWRAIHHLSWPRRVSQGESVNSGISSAAVTLRYYDLDVLMREIGAESRRDPQNQEGRRLWKVDLKDAYRHVVVDREDAPLLGYFWPGYGYLYEAQLSFGGKSAPFLFNLVAEGFEWILRSFGVRCNHYLDDTFGWVRGDIAPQELLEFVTSVAKALGLSTAPHKTLSGSTLEILGITFDCDRGVAYIGDEKMLKIRALLDALTEDTNLQQIRSLAGSLVFVTRVCVLGRAFLRRIFDQVAIMLTWRLPRRRLTQYAKREIEWWRVTLGNYRAIRYLTDEPSFLPELHVWSDASGRLGIGGHLQGSGVGEEFSEHLPRRHRDKDIMFKEAFAVLRCVQLWKGKMHRKLIIFHVDNQALVSALNRGSCKQNTSQAVIRQIYTLATWHSFSLRAVWLSSKENKRADDLSRFVHAQPSAAVQSSYDYVHFDPDLGGDWDIDDDIIGDVPNL